MRRVVAALLTLLVAAALAGAFVLWHAGYRVYAVRTGSMAPTYRPGDAVVDRVGAAHPHVGDVITFRTGQGDVVTHRVHDINALGIHTKGDANSTPDIWTVTPRNILGVAIAGVRDGGYLLVYLKQPSGVASVVTVLVALVLAWELFFPSVPDTPTGPNPGRLSRGPGEAGPSRSLETAVGRFVVVTPLVLVGALVSLTSSTGAYFTDSKTVTVTFAATCHRQPDAYRSSSNSAGCSGRGAIATGR